MVPVYVQRFMEAVSLAQRACAFNCCRGFVGVHRSLEFKKSELFSPFTRTICT